MDVQMLTRMTTQALLLCMYISLPVVFVAAAVGLAVSFVQAITSIQDASIPHGLKLLAVVVALAVAAPWASAALLRFMREIITTAIPS